MVDMIQTSWQNLHGRLILAFAIYYKDGRRDGRYSEMRGSFKFRGYHMTEIAETDFYNVTDAELTDLIRQTNEY
jgi:hypothetical protein